MKLYNGEHLSHAKQFLLFITFTLIIICVVSKTLYSAVTIRAFPDSTNVRHQIYSMKLLPAKSGITKSTSFLSFKNALFDTAPAQAEEIKQKFGWTNRKVPIIQGREYFTSLKTIL